MMLLRKPKPFAAAFARDHQGKTSNSNTINELQFVKEWKDLPCPGILRRFCGMTLWGTDKMIVVGGRDQECRMLDSVEVYDFSRWEWTFLPPLNQPREEGVAIVVEMKLYVFGGFGKGSYLSHCEVLDLSRPEEGFVRLRNDLPQSLKGAVAVSNGHWIYIVGGYNATVGHLDTVFALDTHTLEWDDTFPSLCTARYLPAVTVYGDTLVVAGGRSLGRRGGVKHLRSVECMNLVNGTRWNYMAPMVSSRAGAAAFVLDGNIYVIGGEVREDHPASALMHYSGTRWRQKPFRSMIHSCPGTLLISPSRMSMVSMDNSWDFQCLERISVRESDAFLKFDYKLFQRLEHELNSQPSIERVREFMSLCQLAMEWDEEHHGSHQHDKIAMQIRKVLMQPHVTKILQEEDVGSDSTLAEKNDFFICDDDAFKEADYSQAIVDDTGMACPDGLAPGVNCVSSCVNADPSAVSSLDDCVIGSIDGMTIPIDVWKYDLPGDDVSNVSPVEGCKLGSVAGAMEPVRTRHNIDQPLFASQTIPTQVESVGLVSYGISDKVPVEQCKPVLVTSTEGPVPVVPLINDSVDVNNGLTIPVGNDVSNIVPSEERNLECARTCKEPIITGDFTEDSVDAFNGNATPVFVGSRSFVDEDVPSPTPLEQCNLKFVTDAEGPIRSGKSSGESVDVFNSIITPVVVGSKSIVGDDVPGTLLADPVTDTTEPITGGDSPMESLIEAIDPTTSGDSSDDISNAIVVRCRSLVGDDVPSATPSERSNLESVVATIEQIPTGNSSGESADAFDGIPNAMVVGSRSLVGDNVPSATPSEGSDVKSVVTTIEPIPTGDSSGESADAFDGIITAMVVGSRSLVGDDVPSATPSERSNLESVVPTIEPIPTGGSSGESADAFDGIPNAMVVGSRSLVCDDVPSATQSDQSNIKSVGTTIEPIPTGDSSGESADAFDGITTAMVVGSRSLVGDDVPSATPSEESDVKSVVPTIEPIPTGDSSGKSADAFDGITTATVVGSRSLVGDNVPSATPSEGSDVKSVVTTIEPIPTGDSSGESADAFDGTTTAMVVGSRSLVGDNVPSATPSEKSSIKSVAPTIEPIPTGDSSDEAVDEFNGIITTPAVVRSRNFVEDDVPSATPSEQRILKPPAESIVNEERTDESSVATDCIHSLACNGVPTGPHMLASVAGTKDPITIGALIVGGIVTSGGMDIPMDKVSSISQVEHRNPGSVQSSKESGNMLPRVVSPDQGKAKVPKTIVSTANYPLEVSPRVINPDQGLRTASKSAGGNAKAVTILPPVVSPDQGTSKSSKTARSITKSPRKAPLRVVSPDQGTNKTFKVADGDAVASSDSSYFVKDVRGKVFKPTSRHAIPVHAVQAICDDESSVDELWA